MCEDRGGSVWGHFLYVTKKNNKKNRKIIKPEDFLQKSTFPFFTWFGIDITSDRSNWLEKFLKLKCWSFGIQRRWENIVKI